MNNTEITILKELLELMRQECSLIEKVIDTKQQDKNGNVSSTSQSIESMKSVIINLFKDKNMITT